jgi:exodeoxyribonuclease-3
MRLFHLLDLLEKAQPDIVLLQEIKCEKIYFPIELLNQKGYEVCVSGQKAYNGVAILLKATKAQFVPNSTTCSFLNCPLNSKKKHEARYIEAEIELSRKRICVANVYVPNGKEIPSVSFDFKIEFLKSLRESLHEKVKNQNFVLGGDFNIAPRDSDVFDPKIFKNKLFCSEIERSTFQSIINTGLVDVVQKLNPNHALYTWWDYRGGSFRKNHGLRIDLLLASASLAKEATHVEQYIQYRSYESPSDHIPISVSFDITS